MDVTSSVTDNGTNSFMVAGNLGRRRHLPIARERSPAGIGRHIRSCHEHAGIDGYTSVNRYAGIDRYARARNQHARANGTSSSSDQDAYRDGHS